MMKNQLNKIKEERISNAKIRCHKKVVYNNSGSPISENDENLFSLGLNFRIAPTKFPLVEYISSTEKLCQQMEKSKIKEDKVKAQKIRNIVMNHLRRGCRFKLKSNLTKKL